MSFTDRISSNQPAVLSDEDLMQILRKQLRKASFNEAFVNRVWLDDVESRVPGVWHRVDVLNRTEADLPEIYRLCGFIQAVSGNTAEIYGQDEQRPTTLVTNKALTAGLLQAQTQQAIRS